MFKGVGGVMIKTLWRCGCGGAQGLFQLSKSSFLVSGDIQNQVIFCAPLTEGGDGVLTGCDRAIVESW